jgi:hypothetical protein
MAKAELQVELAALNPLRESAPLASRENEDRSLRGFTVAYGDTIAANESDLHALAIRAAKAAGAPDGTGKI